MNELYIFLSIIVPPIIGTLAFNIYKSKCSNVKLCYGLVEIARDVRGEEKLDINSQNNSLDIINNV